jgi:hypothetical protein
VGDKEEAVGDHAAVSGIRGVKHGEIVEKEDREAHEGEDAPED